MNRVHVRVRAGGEHYALPVDGVREIAKLGQITPVPGAPSSVLGVWNLRGDVMAVLDLATLLGLDAAAETSRILVVEDGEHRAGLTVESVLDVGSLPELLEPADSELLSGSVLIERTPVGVIDIAAMLQAAGSGAAQ